uniref:Secreted protein n=1 Tax=Micrurus lemniscatus lemniscatus TaxID=129467 RepID=A0A2D4HI87_MICLE
MKLPLLLRLMWVMLSNNSALKGQIPLDVSIQWIPLHLLRGRRYKGFLARDTISMIEVNRIHISNQQSPIFPALWTSKRGMGCCTRLPAICMVRLPINHKLVADYRLGDPF